MLILLLGNLYALGRGLRYAFSVLGQLPLYSCILMPYTHKAKEPGPGEGARAGRAGPRLGRAVPNSQSWPATREGGAARCAPAPRRCLPVPHRCGKHGGRRGWRGARRPSVTPSAPFIPARQYFVQIQNLTYCFVNQRHHLLPIAVYPVRGVSGSPASPPPPPPLDVSNPSGIGVAPSAERVLLAVSA